MGKHQMFRCIAALLVAVLMISAFSGCAPAGEPTQPETQPTQETTLPKQEEITTVDRNGDKVLKILMVGNSFCYYYVEELYELLTEKLPEGVEEVEIYNLYYSGCKVDQHFLWWVNKEANYDLFKVDATGRHKMGNGEKWLLEDALAQGDWDYISLQGSVANGSYLNESKRETTRDQIAQMAKPLLAHFHELYPKAQLLWHRTWFSEIGRVTSDGYTYTAEDGPKYDEGMQAICDYMCNEFDLDKPYDLKMVNSGAAWTEARKLNESFDLLPYGGLCARLGYSKFGDMRANSGDGYHDGDIGGAQLLNAYIWYMTITGDTDLNSSTYAPVYNRGGVEYPLSPALIAMLKKAAMTSFAAN